MYNVINSPPPLLWMFDIVLNLLCCCSPASPGPMPTPPSTAPPAAYTGLLPRVVPA